MKDINKKILSAKPLSQLTICGNSDAGQRIDISTKLSTEM
jgi:hypothetical protein